jgi:hypothetical protein
MKGLIICSWSNAEDNGVVQLRFGYALLLVLTDLPPVSF